MNFQDGVGSRGPSMASAKSPPRVAANSSRRSKFISDLNSALVESGFLPELRIIEKTSSNISDGDFMVAAVTTVASGETKLSDPIPEGAASHDATPERCALKVM